jgi:hypothetical protein
MGRNDIVCYGGGGGGGDRPGLAVQPSQLNCWGRAVGLG